MIKNIFLKKIIQKGLLRNKNKKKAISYANSQNMGILVNGFDEIDTNQIENFIRLLFNEGKKVDTLFFNTQKVAPAISFPHKVFSKKDINILGKVTKRDVMKFLRTEFDIVISLTLKSSLPIKNILANCRAKFKVGFGEDGNINPLDLTIKPSNPTEPVKMLEEMMFYLKKINN